MAVNFVARKCACGGKLEFDPAKKIWICKYCGTVVEREATFDKVHVDGIEGIHDVVRQTLMDVANRKMDSAQRNLEDCEKKDHRHIGTLLAHISYELANISSAVSQDEARASMDKVKIFAKRLYEEFPVIAEDEINLYEDFGENAADIYANLLVVFDTLGDTGRLEYLSSRLKVEEVFSPYANKVLLKMALKQGRLDMIDAMVANISHLDRKSALPEMLDHYPDNDRKAALIKALFDSDTAQALSEKYFESYFTNSHDGVETKCMVLSLLNMTDIHCSADAVIKAMGAALDCYEKAKMAFQVIYSIKISDQETEALLAYCLMINRSYDIQAAFFDVLIEKEVFVSFSGRSMISFLDSAESGAGEKAEILKKMLHFRIDPKALDAVCNYYLNNNKDDQETRDRILDILLAEDVPISDRTIRNYVVNTQTDGDNKKTVIEKIFATGIDKVYVGDILSEYLLHTCDENDRKESIFEYLLGLGFKADAGDLARYAVSEDDTQQKLGRIRRLIENGTPVKADTVEQYILSLKNPQDFSAELFDLLTQGSYCVGFQTYAKFVLFCRDADKVIHNGKLLHALHCDLNGQRTSVLHCGRNLLCNIAQAYVLCTNESYDMACAVLQQIFAEKVKLNADIAVNGSAMKFKKYASAHKNELSPLSLRLCEENRMFSLF